MTLWVHLPAGPDDDTIEGRGPASMASRPPTPGLQELVWSSLVWLEPDACLLQGPSPASDTGSLVVQVVGVVDCQSWAGAVLMLG